jgi:hypothetical protein
MRLRNGKTPRSFDCLRNSSAVYKRSIHYAIYPVIKTPPPEFSAPENVKIADISLRLIVGINSVMLYSFDIGGDTLNVVS